MSIPPQFLHASKSRLTSIHRPAAMQNMRANMKSRAKLTYYNSLMLLFFFENKSHVIVKCHIISMKTGLTLKTKV
jgi:hypothetical protein